MGKSNRIGYKQLALMAIMIICIVFGTAQYVKAENEVSFNYSYSSERDTAIYDIRNSYLPLMFPGLSGSEIKTIQITILVHFTDGDYYFDNST